jgi:hypothetical protein
MQRFFGLHGATMLLVLVHAGDTDVRVWSFTSMVGLYHHGRCEERGGVDGIVTWRRIVVTLSAMVHDDSHGLRLLSLLPRWLSIRPDLTLIEFAGADWWRWQSDKY